MNRLINITMFLDDVSTIFISIIFQKFTIYLVHIKYTLKVYKPLGSS